MSNSNELCETCGAIMWYELHCAATMEDPEDGEWWCPACDKPEPDESDDPFFIDNVKDI